MKKAFSILVFVTACVPQQSADQAPDPVAPIAVGDRLRVTHDARCCASPSIGVLQSLSADSLVLESTQPKERLAIARANIFKIQRRNDQDTHILLGMATGLVVGAAIGATVGWEKGGGEFHTLDQDMGALTGGIVGLLVGLVVGARVGSWQTIP